MLSEWLPIGALEWEQNWLCAEGMGGRVGDTYLRSVQCSNSTLYTSTEYLHKKMRRKQRFGMFRRSSKGNWASQVIRRWALTKANSKDVRAPVKGQSEDQ